MLTKLEPDGSLFEAGHFQLRLDVLDRLDAAISFSEVQRDSASLIRARQLAARLEAANAELFQTIRAEIQRGECPALLADLLARFGAEIAAGEWPRGNGYDFLDELIAGVFAFEEPGEDHVATRAENVFYQPTPMRHLLALIASGAISSDDLFIDLGSGLGHVAMLVSICTGARCVGVELETAFVAGAQQCAQRLGLERVSFVEQDAREADFSAGRVFYLYTPFTGSILAGVLESLRREALQRPIKVCAFGPCVEVVAREVWLKSATAVEADRMMVFIS
jgi:histone methylation protein DOT1